MGSYFGVRELHWPRKMHRCAPYLLDKVSTRKAHCQGRLADTTRANDHDSVLGHRGARGADETTVSSTSPLAQ